MVLTLLCERNMFTWYGLKIQYDFPEFYFEFREVIPSESEVTLQVCRGVVCKLIDAAVLSKSQIYFILIHIKQWVRELRGAD